MFPTGVGMNRAPSRKIFAPAYVPHRRGDEPSALSASWFAIKCSPRVWGCTDSVRSARARRANLPTGVGMYRRQQAR